MNTSFVVSSKSGEKKHNQNQNNNNSNKTKTTNNSYKNATTTTTQAQTQQQRKPPPEKHETQITRTSSLPSHTYKWSPFSQMTSNGKSFGTSWLYNDTLCNSSFRPLADPRG